MKVVLLRDVARIGKRREIKDVPSGHALNFLIPRKLALPATPENIRRVAAEKERNDVRMKSHDADFKTALETLSANPIEIPVHANAQGHLFKGLHAADIARRFKELNISVMEDEIVLSHPIKSIGEHLVMLRAGDQSSEITLRITSI